MGHELIAMRAGLLEQERRGGSRMCYLRVIDRKEDRTAQRVDICPALVL